MTLPAGTRLGSYAVEHLIGAGAMGEVYRARDTRLDRAVAIKVLPSGSNADASSRLRFEDEARSLASLNHPHICTVHDLGEDGGSLFLVMELLEGESLRSHMGACCPVPAVVEIVIQVADALESAHAKGIVHRDVKPENIFITTRGAAKLLDFGIAKLLGGRASPNATTRAGTGPFALGTVAYMSPEQVRGEALDARTDLFSLGVVLYELVTGGQPFGGETSGAVLAEILTKTPANLVCVNARVPAELGRVADKLLEKDRDLRYQSAGDVRVDLERLRRTLITPTGVDSRAVRERPSIVVTPFENLSPDPAQDYFCDGMTEEIITALSKLAQLRVISRNSAMSLKGTRRTARQTGRLLNVGHVLEGTVRKAGNDLRITAQLVDAATDNPLWAERYSGTLDDVFTIQEKVAAAIADALKLTLRPAERRSSGVRAIAGPRAQECYRRARHEMFSCTQAGFERAVRLINEGIEAIGEHPVLQVALAQIHYLALEIGIGPREKLLRIALDLTRRIQASDPAHAAPLLGKLERYTGSREMAIRRFEDAVDHDPSDVESICALGCFYGYHAGRPAEAIAVARYLLAIDPLTVMNQWPIALARWAEGDLPAALEILDDMYRREPFWIYQLLRAFVLAGLSRFDAAHASLDAVEAAAEGTASDVGVLLPTAFRHALRGEREELLALIDGPMRETLGTDAELPVWTAGWLALAGESGRALHLLECWVARGSFNYPMLAHGDPFLASLRGEPRFQRLLDRVRPSWEAFVPRFVPTGGA